MPCPILGARPQHAPVLEWIERDNPLAVRTQRHPSPRRKLDRDRARTLPPAHVSVLDDEPTLGGLSCERTILEYEFTVAPAAVRAAIELSGLDPAVWLD